MLVQQQSAMTSLYRRWFSFLFAGLAFLVIGFITLKAYWAAGYAMRWLLLTGMILSYQIWLLRKNLPFNHRIGEQTLLPVLGIGNTITLFRGVLFAGLTGFLLAPRPLAGLAWIPALCIQRGSD
jgi:CDP-diacylglycerol--glycerol-3-phosphate 3-phosphatidyltransferase